MDGRMDVCSWQFICPFFYVIRFVFVSQCLPYRPSAHKASIYTACTWCGLGEKNDRDVGAKDIFSLCALSIPEVLFA